MKRLIPVLLYKDGYLVKSRNFKEFQTIGNPFEEVKRFNEWNVDELIFLNISSDIKSYQGRPDFKNQKYFEYIDLIKEINKNCFMPLTFGGGIRSFSDIEKILKNGADKVVINSLAFYDHKQINHASEKFGNQALVLNIDVKKIKNEYFVFIERGTVNTEISLSVWLEKIKNNIDIGEILIQRIDFDGMACGYDLDLIEIVKNKLNLPLIILGGLSKYNDFVDARKKEQMDLRKYLALQRNGRF